MSKQPGLSPQQRQRIVQGLEVSVFVAGALLFQTYHPLWMWPLGIRTLVTVGVFLGAFLLYVAICGQSFRRGSLPANGLPEHLTVVPDKPSPGASLHEQPGSYQVPRRFSLLSICGITMAYALLVAALRSLHAPPMISGCVLAFFAFVALSQIILHRVPRAASALVGLVLALLAISFSKTAVAFVEAFSPIVPLSDPWRIVVAAGLGAVFGYFAGVFSAALFLIADSFRRWFRGTAWAESTNEEG